jgi:hypothetical protein
MHVRTHRIASHAITHARTHAHTHARTRARARNTSLARAAHDPDLLTRSCMQLISTTARFVFQATDITLGIRASRMRRRKTDTDAVARNNLRAVATAEAVSSSAKKTPTPSPSTTRKSAPSDLPHSDASTPSSGGLVGSPLLHGRARAVSGADAGVGAPPHSVRSRSGSGGASALGRARAATVGPAVIGGQHV